jgi:hypothetical protein
MKRWQTGVLALSALAVALLLWRDSARPPQPPPAVAATVAAPEPPAYDRDVKPILDNRCVVCHACYDAPCQLQLGSFEGLQRGASRTPVYDSTRLTAAAPTRLFIDAQTTAQWRERGFFPVLDAGAQTPPANPEDSLLYRMLQLKQRHPLPGGDVPDVIDLSLERKAFCPRLDDFDKYARERPLQGMPFALPGLRPEEFATLKRWLEGGAKGAPAAPLSPELQGSVAQWEKFLNGDTLKVQLMSRYLYEHLFLADLYFDGGGRQFFKLVRSRTPPGAPLDPIADRRPFDDPGAVRIYYRLRPVRSTIVAKTHLPYALGPQRLQRYRELFLDPAYQVTELPSYAPAVASNPFIAFAQLPVASRYRFLLDDAEFIIMNFIKGPVCRGQLALNVIQDRFWVLFANPDIEATVDSAFLARESGNLRLPAAAAGNPVAAVEWHRYAALQARYLAAKSQYLHNKFGNRGAVNLSLLWRGGDTHNTNAALTVFRHFDSASVVKGLVGETPKTAWVLDYPLLERIHYLLVAGFDVYGDASQQLLTRLYMDFLRMEGEYNFLAFLPRAQREPLRDSWYRGVGAKLRDAVYRKVPEYQHETGITYRSKHVLPEFFAQLRDYLGSAVEHRYDLEGTELGPPAEAALRELAALRGRAAAQLPELVFLRVVRKNAPDAVFSLIHDDDHSNVAVLFLEKERRRPQFDALTVAPGFIGAYPNAFWKVQESELPQLVRAVAALRSAGAYRTLQKRYGVLRSSDDFWRQSDWMHSTYRQRDAIGWGMLDYNRYEK